MLLPLPQSLLNISYICDSNLIPAVDVSIVIWSSTSPQWNTEIFILLFLVPWLILMIHFMPTSSTILCTWYMLNNMHFRSSNLTSVIDLSHRSNIENRSFVELCASTSVYQSVLLTTSWLVGLYSHPLHFLNHWLDSPNRLWMVGVSSRYVTLSRLLRWIFIMFSC